MPSFDYMFTASSALILARGNIDSAGNFSVDLPATTEESLYRLHFIREGDPAATLLIGSRDVNHVFFVASRGDHIYFEKGQGLPISQSAVRGSKANAELNTLLKLAASDTTGNNALISLADGATSPLVGLLAISRTDKLSDRQKKRVSDLLRRYDPQNTYGTNIFWEYRTPPYGKWYLAGGLLLMASLSLYGYLFYKRQGMVKRWRGLSQRERDMVGLMLSGKSNKEAALALNIELSTVKTHVNNIYAKLRVNNRKDLDRYKEFIKDRSIPPMK